MSEQHDPSDFIDSDFQSGLKKTGGSPFAAPASPSGSSAVPNRPPTREELEALMSEKQTKLAELKRVQEELERERSGLEELRRRQIECQTGREEMLKNLTRGIGLLEEAELAARQEADQMSRSLTEFRAAITKLQAINQQQWSQQNLTVELTRALTIIENARMEWNSARVKFPILSDDAALGHAGAGLEPRGSAPLEEEDFRRLVKIGLAFTWPILLLGVIIWLTLLFKLK
jgi:hypothetical protein